ncbi:SFT2-domain-containing protein, partial [Ascobolus immersus RN42]
MSNGTFASQIGGLGWTRRPDPPVTTARPSFLSSINPFSDSGYIRLPSTNQDAASAPLPARTAAQEEAGYFALSRWDRMLAFACCNVGALVCFMLCFFLFPILTLKPRKFAILWTLGSLLFLSSWAFLNGAKAYAKHLLSQERLVFTAAYFASIGGTLWASLGVKSTLLTILFAVIQLVALLWYTLSYFPMGREGLRFASQVGARQVGNWMSG